MGASDGSSSTSLKPNVAGLLCYLGVWVTGIVFLIIERKNKQVRFHAMQSLVTFGILFIILSIINGVRAAWAWSFYGAPGLYTAQWVIGSIVWWIFFAIIIILWIVLMVRTYNGQLYKVPLFGGIAEKCIAKLDGGK